jgi:hypothetical protein
VTILLRTDDDLAVSGDVTAARDAVLTSISALSLSGTAQHEAIAAALTAIADGVDALGMPAQAAALTQARDDILAAVQVQEQNYGGALG